MPPPPQEQPGQASHGEQDRRDPRVEQQVAGRGPDLQGDQRALALAGLPVAAKHAHGVGQRHHQGQRGRGRHPEPASSSPALGGWRKQRRRQNNHRRGQGHQVELRGEAGQRRPQEVEPHPALPHGGMRQGQPHGEQQVVGHQPALTGGEAHMGRQAGEDQGGQQPRQAAAGEQRARRAQGHGGEAPEGDVEPEQGPGRAAQQSRQRGQQGLLGQAVLTNLQVRNQRVVTADQLSHLADAVGVGVQRRVGRQERAQEQGHGEECEHGQPVAAAQGPDHAPQVPGAEGGQQHHEQQERPVGLEQPARPRPDLALHSACPPELPTVVGLHALRHLQDGGWDSRGDAG